MCGISGYVLSRPAPVDPGLLETMLGTIRRRGPDGEGAWIARRSEGVVLHARTDATPASVRGGMPHIGTTGGTPHDCAVVHARYAVMDRSDATHQPWVTPDGRISVAFQGELFNYVELRTELEALGSRFRTDSDTEVLAHAVRAWGDEAWHHFNGFWAAVVLDRDRGEVVLCRDRLGIAPLYLGAEEGRLWFSSSALGLARLLERGTRVDRAAAKGFVETGLRDFDGTTFFDGVHAFPPGCTLRLGPGSASPDGGVERRYWSLPSTPLSGRDLSLEDAAARLRDILGSAVEMRLRGDRELAFQLSGGLDSAAVVALASERSAAKLSTYTVSVPEEDEEPRARSMERLHSLDRKVLRGREEALLEELSSFTLLMEEPVQAPGAWGHHDLCRTVRADGFGVVLSGSGGDEVLAGYEWDFWPAARTLMRARGQRLATIRYDAVLRYGSPARRAEAARAWVRWAGRLPGRVRRHVATPPASGAGFPSTTTVGGATPRGAAELAATYPGLGYEDRRRYHFERAHLPYYLSSNDRATLGIPIEHRQPFLDHRVVELGMVLPPEHLFRAGWTKYVLREAMRGRIPEEILWRREKTGFPFPLRRFLTSHEDALAPLARRWDGWSGQPADDDFLERAHANPGHLWRTCAVGAWLDLVDP